MRTVQFVVVSALVAALAACAADGSDSGSAPGSGGAVPTAGADGAPPTRGGSPGPADPCELFTAADASRVLGGPVESVAHDTSISKLNVRTKRCQYDRPGQDFSKAAAVQVHVGTQRYTVDEFETKVKKLADPAGIQPITATEVPGLGDRAYQVGGNVDTADAVWVVAGDRLVATLVQDDRGRGEPAKAVEVARTVVARLT